MQGAERGRATRQIAALTVAKARAQRLQEPRAAVVGRAAADAHDDQARAGVERGGDQLAGAVGRCTARIEPSRRDEDESARRRHLDDRGRSLQRKRCLDRFAERAFDPHGSRLRAGIEERRHRPLAAVCHRHDGRIGAGHDVAQPCHERVRYLARAAAPLELVGRDDDPHRCYDLESETFSVIVAPAVTVSAFCAGA